ncbi:hypothetical protein [Cellulomonas sp. KRMCY2]|uniref:hypothetical protein n=1 Tax=Cellulomonas sp. KRMCY2 TaxID=1304865 RepID=UPI00045EC193|nr:hypothetical protein [Cellulomonas sp. KRMCY2]
MSTPVLIGVERFTVKHRITLTENLYELRTLGPNDEHGEIFAFARMEQMTLSEEFRFFADKERRAPLFSFRAQTRMNLGHATYDVLDAGGMRIGYLQHQFFASKVRETWRLGAPGVEAVGHQRSEAVGVLRRTWRPAGPHYPSRVGPLAAACRPPMYPKVMAGPMVEPGPG